MRKTGGVLSADGPCHFGFAIHQHRQVTAQYGILAAIGLSVMCNECTEGQVGSGNTIKPCQFYFVVQPMDRRQSLQVHSRDSLQDNQQNVTSTRSKLHYRLAFEIA